MLIHGQRINVLEPCEQLVNRIHNNKLSVPLFPEKLYTAIGVLKWYLPIEQWTVSCTSRLYSFQPVG